MKTKVTIEEVKNEDDSFPMSEMEPGQLCVIIGNCDRKDVGNLILRTLSICNFEVMNLEEFSNGKTWTGENNTILVKQAQVGTKVIFEVI